MSSNSSAYMENVTKKSNNDLLENCQKLNLVKHMKTIFRKSVDSTEERFKEYNNRKRQ